MSEGLHTSMATFICTIYVHTYTHTYVHNIYLYMLTQSIAPNKMAYPTMHEQYAVTIVPDFLKSMSPLESPQDSYMMVKLNCR